jgi:hypothetical protein
MTGIWVVGRGKPASISRRRSHVSLGDCGSHWLATTEVECGSLRSSHRQAGGEVVLVWSQAYVMGSHTTRRPRVRPNQFDRQTIVDPFRAMPCRRGEPGDHPLAVRPQPRCDCALAQGELLIASHIDIGEYGPESGSQLMASQYSTGDRFTANKRSVISHAGRLVDGADAAQSKLR